MSASLTAANETRENSARRSASCSATRRFSAPAGGEGPGRRSRLSGAALSAHPDRQFSGDRPCAGSSLPAAARPLASPSTHGRDKTRDARAVVGGPCLYATISRDHDDEIARAENSPSEPREPHHGFPQCVGEQPRSEPLWPAMDGRGRRRAVRAGPATHGPGLGRDPPGGDGGLHPLVTSATTRGSATSRQRMCMTADGRRFCGDGRLIRAGPSPGAFATIGAAAMQGTRGELTGDLSVLRGLTESQRR